MVAEVQKRQVPSVSYGTLAKLAAPIWISNLAVTGGGTIDTLMVGHLGPVELAGVAIGLAVTVSIMVALTGIMFGISPIVGHHFGAGKYNQISFELHQAIWIGLAFSVVGVVLICATPMWMKLTNSTGEVARIATLYLIINACGLPAAMIARAFTAVNAAVSRPKIAMFIALITLVLKLPLNFLFIYGWGPIKGLGGPGCALSSTVSVWVTLILFWLVWHYDSFYDRMKQPKFARPQWAAIAIQLKIGIPIALTSFFEVTSFTFMTLFISRLGPVIVSGHQIVANITTLLYTVPISIAISGSVLVSQSLGAESPSSAKMATFHCQRAAIFLAALVSIALYFFKETIISWYTPDQAVIAVAVQLIFFACIFHVFDAANCASAFSMRGYRITVVPMVLYGVLLWSMGLGLGSIMCFTDWITSEPQGAVGFWKAITGGLIAIGITVSTLAGYVATTVAAGKPIPKWIK